MKDGMRTILRCTCLALMVMAALAIIPAAMEAQATHLMTIGKSCVSPKNRCTTDADCADANLCDGAEQCATEGSPGSNVVDCTITLQNPVTHADAVIIREACDTITGFAGPSTSCDILVSSTTGTGCAAGQNLDGTTITCTLDPGEFVTFRSNFYVVQPADPATLPDQATITYNDTCNGSVSGCSTDVSELQITAATTTVSGCSEGTPVNCPGDGNFCNGPESCNPATGLCVSGPNVAESTACTDTDGNLCTFAGCDGLGVCDQNHINQVCTDDGNFCNGPESCVPATGLCVSGPNVAESTACTDTDGNLCTFAGCDGAGVCDQGHINQVCTDDGNFCNGPESCVPATGLCESGPDVAESTACTDTDGNLCTFAGCDGAGTCDQGHINQVCSDPICTACNPTTGVCEPFAEAPAECFGVEICRTPGFWGSHGGTEKDRSTNITLAVLNAYNAANDPDLSICGRTITNTDAGNVNSALEAICVSVKGDPRRQLARQLMAAALNCIMTNTGDGDSCVALVGDVCAGVSVEDFFGACNAACAGGDVTIDVDADNNPATAPVEVSCISAIDCFNNGGNFDPTDGSCDAAINSCHDQELDNGCLDFSPSGPAGSPRECNEARKNEIYVPVPLAP